MTVHRSMSKKVPSFLLVLLAVVEILQFLNNSPAQAIDVTVTLDPTAAAVNVDGRFLDPTRPNRTNLSFLREFAGTIGIADRITNVSVRGVDGGETSAKRLMSGEYLTETDIAAWRYDISLKPVGRPSARAHVSWVEEGRGILFLDDLLPQLFSATAVDARLKLSMPPGWRIVSPPEISPDGSFLVKNIERSSFVITNSPTVRTNKTRYGTVSVFDTWNFTESEAATMVDEISARYELVFGSPPPRGQRVTLMRMPSTVGAGNWEADTRGDSLTIISSDMPFKSQSLQRLHEQLRHEIFHLWIPNGLDIKGHYDWFYEGFAQYASLRAGVWANRIRFTDYLDSMSMAMSIDAMNATRDSLIEASAKRWQGANSRVYARGMVLAFLCDLALLERSKGRISVENLLRDIYLRALSAANQNGNDVILASMQKYPELMPLVDRYITGSVGVDAETAVKVAGIKAERDQFGVKLSIVEKPVGRQRDLLDKLGYNNWRKLAESSK